jgi:hypothetical protein
MSTPGEILVLADLIDRYSVSIGHDSYSLSEDERKLVAVLLRDHVATTIKSAFGTVGE